MKKLFTTLSVLAALCLATSAFATQYPPGPGNCCTDSLTIINLQNPAAIPFPAVPDTVHGVGGIITGFDPKPTGFGFYIQMSNGLPYSGIDVFTGATNKQASPFSLAIGDSVVVYGKKQEFGNGTEIEGLDTSQSTDDCLVRKVSSGNPVPAFHVGTPNELQELPTNPFAEQWEGMLVRINGPLKVARTSFTGGMGFNSFKLVDPTCAGPICDSVLVDGNTLATYTPPAVNTTVDWVQGIYEQRTTYRIQLRDGNDIQVATPPNVTDAYFIDTNKIRVVYDRNVTVATATDLANYSLASLDAINSAVMDGTSATILDVTSTLGQGNPEALTVSNIAGLANGLIMQNPQTRNFTSGILTPAIVQGPDTDSLAVSAFGCADVARFLGTNNGASSRISVRGVCVAKIGSLYYLQNSTAGYRNGVGVFAPIAPLTVGHDYLVVGSMQDFPAGNAGESEVVSTQYIVDKGVATGPAPIDATVPELANRTCDATQSIVTGEDLEGVLVKVSYAKIVPFNDPFTGFTAGNGFRVVGPLGVENDTILVDNDIDPLRTYLPVVGNVVSVTGIIQDSFGIYRLQPRGDFDILDHGAITGVPGGLPAKVTFAIAPNPSRSSRVSFGLPVRNTVELSVFDLQGRKLATLAQGTLDAGNHTRAWDGLDDSGRAVGSGVYFYRLQVGAETFTLRGIKLD